MALTTFIYALCEPGTRTVRYIGKTSDMAKRLTRHIKVSAKLETYLGHWLHKLVSEGRRPDMILLREVQGNGSEAEMRFIRHARGCRMDLVNSTDGGEGITMTPEIRKKISTALTRSPEHCAAARKQCAVMSAAKRGVPHSPEHRAAISAALKGVPHGPHSPESNAKRSAALKGVPKGPFSPEHCAAMSAAQIGKKMSPEFCAAQSARQKGVPFSPERCAAMSAATKGVPKSPEHCAAMSAARMGMPWSPARRAAYEAGKSAKPAIAGVPEPK